MTGTIRRFLALEAIAFVIAALVHAGVLVDGLTYSWLRPSSIRRTGLAVQGFALLGTLVGAFTIAIGIGPRTGPDMVYHVGLLVVLSWGLAVAARSRLSQSP